MSIVELWSYFAVLTKQELREQLRKLSRPLHVRQMRSLQNLQPRLRNIVTEVRPVGHGGRRILRSRHHQRRRRDPVQIATEIRVAQRSARAHVALQRTRARDLS